MADWARGLADDDIASLISTQGTSRTVLTPPVKSGDAGLSALRNDNGQPSFWLHGTVLSGLAPTAAARHQAILGREVGFRMGIQWAAVSQELLEPRRGGYREAAHPQAGRQDRLMDGGAQTRMVVVRTVRTTAGVGRTCSGGRTSATLYGRSSGTTGTPRLASGPTRRYTRVQSSTTWAVVPRKAGRQPLRKGVRSGKSRRT